MEHNQANEDTLQTITHEDEGKVGIKKQYMYS